MGCYSFFTARQGVMSSEWKEFCTQRCLDAYSQGGTNRTDEQLHYAQQVLKSVETRPDATGVRLMIHGARFTLSYRLGVS